MELTTKMKVYKAISGKTFIDISKELGFSYKTLRNWLTGNQRVSAEKQQQIEEYLQGVKLL